MQGWVVSGQEELAIMERAHSFCELLECGRRREGKERGVELYGTGWDAVYCLASY